MVRALVTASRNFCDQLSAAILALCKVLFEFESDSEIANKLANQGVFLEEFVLVGFKPDQIERLLREAESIECVSAAGDARGEHLRELIADVREALGKDPRMFSMGFFRELRDHFDGDNDDDLSDILARYNLFSQVIWMTNDSVITVKSLFASAPRNAFFMNDLWWLVDRKMLHLEKGNIFICMNERTRCAILFVKKQMEMPFGKFFFTQSAAAC